jgi:hypothetical protein
MEGGPLQMETAYKIWREGNTGAGAACAQYPGNANIPVREVVVFDEAENFVAGTLDLPETALVYVHDPVLPQLTNGATALGNGCSPETCASEASQAGGVTIGTAANNNP